MYLKGTLKFCICQATLERNTEKLFAGRMDPYVSFSYRGSDFKTMIAYESG